MIKIINNIKTHKADALCVLFVIQNEYLITWMSYHPVLRSLTVALDLDEAFTDHGLQKFGDFALTEFDLGGGHDFADGFCLGSAQSLIHFGFVG